MTWFRAIGALLFGLALAGAAYVMVRVWPRAEPIGVSALWPALALNSTLFTLFAVHHSLFARTAVKNRVRARIGPDGERTLYVWIASALLLAVMFGWRPVGYTLYRAADWLSPLLVLLQAIGIGIILLAGRVIDALELAGLRRPTEGRLDVRGPYRLVRHPIYLGFLLVAWAAPTMTGDRAWFASLSTLYLLLAIPLEERSMQRGLGASYAAYRAAVRWRLVPGLY